MKGIDPASHIRARHVRQVEDEVLQYAQNIIILLVHTSECVCVWRGNTQSVPYFAFVVHAPLFLACTHQSKLLGAADKRLHKRVSHYYF